MTAINHGGPPRSAESQFGYPLADIGFTCDSAPLARQQCLVSIGLRSVTVTKQLVGRSHKEVVRPISIAWLARDGMSGQVLFDLAGVGVTVPK
jgi:hypothetical protein